MLCNAAPINTLNTAPTNIRAQADGPDMLLSWHHSNQDVGYRYLVGVNGNTIAVVPPSPSGEHSISLRPPAYRTSVDVLPIKPSVLRFPDLHGDPYGRSVYLDWQKSTDADCRAYNIYWNAGSGLPTTLLATNDQIALEPLYYASASGTGTGKVSVFGSYTGEDVNTEFRIKISASGFQHNLGGSYGAATEFAKGSTFPISNGLAVRFEDERTSYDTDDYYPFNVGPVSSYSYPGALEDGDYAFTVTALDAAGNESAALTQKTVTITGLPPALEDVNLAPYASGVMRLSWTLPNGYTHARIYSNYSSIFAAIQDEVIEEHYYAQTSGTSHYDFSYTASGVYQFYARTYDAARNLESDDATIYELDTTALPTGVKLNAPTNLTVTPTASGTFHLTWLYEVEGGTDLQSFHLYVNTSNTSPSFVSCATISGSADVAQPFILFETDTGSYPGTRYFTMRAASGVYETTNSELIIGVPDATAPSITGPLYGASN